MTTQRFDPLPARDQQAVIAQVINGFLAGDPIWSIAKATNMSSWETMNLLSRRIAERGEEERSRGLRHRCSVAAEALYQNEERIWQLLDAVIEGKDIPKVLAAVAVSLDVEVATDLLRSPDIFIDIHAAIEVVVLPLPTDIFSLLYVVGHGRGLEPDQSLHSLIAMRRYFGAQESVIGAVMPSEVEDEFDGMVEMLKKENILEHGWARAGELVGDALADMPWNSFLSIDYGGEADGPRRPYAQASPSTDGVWCEIVSEDFLPAEEWPINEAYLLRNG